MMSYDVKKGDVRERARIASFIELKDMDAGTISEKLLIKLATSAF